MSKILQFSYNTAIGDTRASFAVSRKVTHGGRTFVVQTANSLKKDKKTYNTNLKTTIDTLKEVDQVRVKSLEDITKFHEAITLVNKKVNSHNKFKIILKCILFPWAIVSLIKGTFYEEYVKVQDKHVFSIDFSSKPPPNFSKVMQKLQGSKENIVELDFSNYPLTPDNFNELLNALKTNTTVRSLVLTQPDEGLQFTRNSLQMLSTSIKACPNIDSISFSGQSLGGENFQVLGELLATNQIKHLDLSKTNLSVDNVKDLKNTLSTNSELKSLNLSSNDLQADGAKVIAEILDSHQSITSLAISGIRMSSRDSKALADAIKNHTSLQIVDISNNYLEDANCIHYAEALKQNNQIKWFNFSSNTIGEDAAIAFGSAMSDHPNLEHISFYNNEIPPVGIEAIAEGIKHNTKTLHYIDLGENGIERKTFSYNVLKNALAKNKKPRRIRYTTPEKAVTKVLKPTSTLKTLAPVGDAVVSLVMPAAKGVVTQAIEYASPYLTPEPEDFWETDPGVLRKK